MVLTKEDKAHGSLLIINELIRSSSFEGEVMYTILGYNCEIKLMMKAKSFCN